MFILLLLLLIIIVIIITIGELPVLTASRSTSLTTSSRQGSGQTGSSQKCGDSSLGNSHGNCGKVCQHMAKCGKLLHVATCAHLTSNNDDNM